MDCYDVCYGSAYLDECGTCVSGSTGLEPGYYKDCNGTCFGPMLEECGACWNPDGENATAPYDCMGECGGSAVIDACGTCILGTSGKDVGFSFDCDGVCFGFAEYDHCGNCRGGETGILPRPDGLACFGAVPCGNTTFNGIVTPLYEDCAGDCGGAAYYDKHTGFCRDANGTYIQGSTKKRGAVELQILDCAGTPNGTAYINLCGICVSGVTGERDDAGIDCNNECADAFIDTCKRCVGGNTGAIAGQDKDCAGFCFGTAVTDDCGECVLGSTGREFNAAMDCAGQCYGNHQPGSESCLCDPDMLDACYQCNGDNSTCAGCDGEPWSGIEYDLCGQCNGDSSTCCFYPGEFTRIIFNEEGSTPEITRVVTGGTIRLENRLPWTDTQHEIVLTQLDAKIEPFQAVVGYVSLGNALEFSIKKTGHYVWSSALYPIFTGEILVTYNTNTTDDCGICGGDGSECCVGYEDDCLRPDETEERRKTPTIIEIKDHVTSPGAFDILLGDWIRFENHDELEYMVSFDGPAILRPIRLKAISTTEMQMRTSGTYYYEDKEHNLLRGYITVVHHSEQSSSDTDTWDITLGVLGSLLIIGIGVLSVLGCLGVIGYAFVRWLRSPVLIEQESAQQLLGEL